MLRKIFLAFITAVFLISGIIIGAQTDQLESALGNSEPTYHITYDRQEVEGSWSSFLSKREDPELYSHNGNRKILHSGPLLTSGRVVATFDYRDQRIKCSEIRSPLFDELGCELNSSSEYGQLFIDDYREMEDVNVTSDGSMEILGRTCNRYIVDVPPEKLDYLEGYAGRLVLCTDQEKGYPALINVNRTQDYDLREDTSERVAVFRAKSYSTDVSASDVTPPVDIATDLVCGSSRTARAVSVYPIEYTGNVTLTVDGENQTVSVTEGEFSNISLSRAEQFWNRDKVIRIYTENGLSSASRCSFYDE